MYVENIIVHMLVATLFYVVGRFFYQNETKTSETHALDCHGRIHSVYETIILQWNAGISPDTGKFYLDVYRSNEMAGVNWIPFRTIADYSFQTNELVGDWEAVSFLNLARNVFLFHSFGGSGGLLEEFY